MASPVITSEKISLLACTLTPGTVLHKVTFTSKPGGLDLSGAVSGRVRYVNPTTAAVSYWTLTLVGTPTARAAVMTHAMGATDLDAADVGTNVSLRALVTVGSTECIDGPESYFMPVVP